MVRLILSLDDCLASSGPSATLATVVARALDGKLPAPPPPEKVQSAIAQGSVWLGKKRIKQASATLRQLRDMAARMDVADFRGANGPAIQIFWPEKPISEYSLAAEQLVFEDDDILLVYKPAGVNTCQSVFSDLNCLTWGVQKLLDARAGIASDPMDTEREEAGRYVVRTINRLDYATRGLVFYAKHKVAEKALHRMFMERRMHKRYLAATPVFDIAARLAATAGDACRVAGQPGGADLRLTIRDILEWQGKPQSAATIIRLLGERGGRLWWAVLPQTGRTHQIRKHFARYLVPIEGDSAYGGQPTVAAAHTAAPGIVAAGGLDAADDQSEENQSADPDSLMLACVAYRFRHPLSGARTVIKRLPPDMGWRERT